jgi:8-oxo-dGTP diphosphatase
LRKPRPAARLLIIDPEHHVLMFRFDAGDGRPFWATPGGACDPGETFAQAAQREMAEETGLTIDPGCEVHRRRVEFTTLEGEEVWSDERYFLVHTPDRTVNISGHTELERRVMKDHRWWALDALATTTERIFPEDIATMLETLL